MTEKRTRIYFAYLTLLAVAGIFLAIYTTLPFGAGVSSDAVRNLATASNVLTGNEFFDYMGEPLLWWPPLYPLLLAALAKLFRLDIFIVGWILNVLLFGCIIWLAGLLFYRIFKGSIFLAYLASLAVFLSLPLLKICANIASDPLFIGLILFWFVLWGNWGGKLNFTLLGLILTAALAAYQRYLGTVLIGSGALLILMRFYKDLRRGFFLAAIFGFFSFLPLAAWLAGHNYLQYQTIFGPRNNEALPWSNLLNATGKILDWFYPYYSVEKLVPFLYLLIIPMGLMLWLVNKKESKQSWLNSIKGDHAFPILFFSAIYFLVLVLTTETQIQRYTDSDRYQVVVLFALLIMISITLDKLVLSNLNAPARHLLLIAFFATWSVYSIYNLNKYITGSRMNGETSYNLYNTRAFHESPSIQVAARILKDDPGAFFYSNIPGAVWFYTRHSLVELIPISNWTKDEFKEKMAGWPNAKPGYIIWFDPDPYEIYYPPHDLGLIAELTMISSTRDGMIFYATPRTAP